MADSFLYIILAWVHISQEQLHMPLNIYQLINAHVQFIKFNDRYIPMQRCIIIKPCFKFFTLGSHSSPKFEFYREGPTHPIHSSKCTACVYIIIYIIIRQPARTYVAILYSSNTFHAIISRHVESFRPLILYTPKFRIFPWVVTRKRTINLN